MKNLLLVAPFLFIALRVVSYVFPERDHCAYTPAKPDDVLVRCGELVVTHADVYSALAAQAAGGEINGIYARRDVTMFGRHYIKVFYSFPHQRGATGEFSLYEP